MGGGAVMGKIIPPTAVAYSLAGIAVLSFLVLLVGFAVGSALA